MARVLERLSGAPTDIVELHKNFTVEGDAWQKIADHFIGMMSLSGTKFVSVPEEGAVTVKFMRAPGTTYGAFRGMSLVTDIGFNSNEATIIYDRGISDSNLLPFLRRPDSYSKGCARITKKEVVIGLDLPMSILLGTIHYRHVKAFMQQFAVRYSEESDVVKMMTKSLNNIKSKLLGDIDSRVQQSESSINSYLASVRQASREVLTLTNRRLSLAEATHWDNVIKGLSELLEKGYFADIRFTDTHVTAVVTGVKLTYNGYEYKYGDFRIEIAVLDGEVIAHTMTPQVLTDGQSRRTRGYTHPHVTDSGDCCLGNYQKLISQAVIANKYQLALSLFYDFIFAYNPSNPFRGIENWMDDATHTSFANGTYRPPSAAVAVGVAGASTVASVNYEACFAESARIFHSGQGSRLRCIDRPYSYCATCPHSTETAEGADAAFEACHANIVSTATCMNCAMGDCPHYNDEEEACLNLAVGTEAAIVDDAPVGSVLRVIACLDCPHGNEGCSYYDTEAGYDNCWTLLQSRRPEAQRACAVCPHTDCAHNANTVDEEEVQNA
jgi:hypothetical protein